MNHFSLHLFQECYLWCTLYSLRIQLYFAASLDGKYIDECVEEKKTTRETVIK